MKKQTRVSIGLYALAATMVCVILLAPDLPNSIIKPLCLAMLACLIVLSVIIPARSKNGRARVWAGLWGLLAAALPLYWFLCIALEWDHRRLDARLILVAFAWGMLAVIVGSLLVRRKRQANQEWTARFAADRQRREEEQATNKD